MPVSSLRLPLAALLCLCLAAAPRADETLNALENTVVERLADLVDAAAEGRTSAETETGLMSGLAELLQRSSEAGRSTAAVERRLEYRATKRFGRDVPPLLMGPDGRLDITALVDQAAASLGRSPAPKPVKTAKRGGYLSAIMAEGSETTVASAIDEAKSAVPQPTSSAADESPLPATRAAEPAQLAASQLQGRVETEGGARFITVKAGDTLGRLASEVYGDFFQYRRIYVANRDQIANPNLLAPGTRLRLP